MEDNREMKASGIKEPVLDIFCIAASYGILFLLPQQVGFLFYLLFGISAFLFCVGFFRLGFAFDAPADPKGELSAGLLCAVAGLVINAAGLYGIWKDQGSGRSIMIATLLLIEALVLYAMAGSGFKTPEGQRLSAVIFRAAAVLLVLSGIAFTIWKHLDAASVIAAAMLLIEGICLWQMGSGSNPFNSLTSEIQTVPGLRTPLGELQEAFSSVETQLGYPRIGKVQTIRQDAIIYGPSENGFYVYGYYLFGRFYVAASTNPLFPDPEDTQRQTVLEVPDSRGVLLSEKELPKAYVRMFTRYAESGKAEWITDHTELSVWRRSSEKMP